MAQILPEPTRELSFGKVLQQEQEQIPLEQKSLDDMSFEELEKVAAGLGVSLQDEDTLPVPPEDPLAGKSVDELEMILADLQAEPTFEEQRIEAEPTAIEAYLPEAPVDVAQQVTGKPRALQVFEQAFKPFAEESLPANIMQLATETDEEREARKEETFQEELVSRTGVFDIDKEIRDIEDTAEAEGRDLTDPELDRLFELQDQRNQIEAKAREVYEDVGAVTRDPEVSVSQIVDTVIQNPGEMGRVLVNELAKNPYELLIPAGWAKAAHTAKTAATAVTSSQRLIKGAEIIGGTAGVAGLAAATGAAVDVAEQLTERGTVDQKQAIEQAKVAATLGAVVGAATPVVREVAATVKENRAIKAIKDEDIDAYLDKRAAMNTKDTGIYVDSSSDVLISKELPSKALLDEQEAKYEAELTQEQYIADQTERFASKMDRVQRKEVGERINVLKGEILKDNEKLIQLNDRVFEIINNAEGRTDAKVDRAVKSTRGNANVVFDRYTQNVTELKELEDMMLQDRDLGLEILRVQERNNRFDDVTMSGQIEEMKRESGLVNVTAAELRASRNIRGSHTPEGKKSPKILRNLFGGTDKSLNDLGHSIAPPSETPTGNGIFKREGESFWNFLVDNTYGQSVSRIDNLAEASPTAKKLRNIMRHDGESVLKEPAHTDRVIQNIGLYTTRLKDAMDPIRTSLFNQMNKDEAASVLAILRGGKTGGASAEARDSAKKIRRLLNNFVGYARKAGHEVGFVGDYFPRVYDKNKLKTEEQQEAFMQVLIKSGRTRERAGAVLDKILAEEGVIDFSVKPLSREMVLPESQPLRRRSLDDISDEDLAPFLSDNLFDTLNSYISSGVRAVEFTRSFGKGGEKFLQMHQDIIGELAKKNVRMREVESQRMFDLVNALHGNYGRFQSKVGETLSSTAVTTQHLLTLPLVTLTSLVEPFIGLSRARPTSWAKGLGGAVKSAANRSTRKIFKNFPQDELSREMDELGLVADSALAEHLSNLLGGEADNKKLNKVTAAFFRANFLHQWTGFVRTLAYESGRQDILKNLKLLNDPTLADFRRTAIETDMGKLGIDLNEAIKWMNDGADVKEPYYAQIRQAAFRYANDVMVHPDATNRPIYFSSPKAAILNQLLSYPTVFTNTVLHDWYKSFSKGNPYYKSVHGVRVAGTVLAMLAAASFGDSMKEKIQWGDRGNPHLINETDSDYVTRLASKAGLLGPAQMLADANTAIEYGSDAVTSRLGPSIGLINKYAKGFSNYAEDDGDTLKKALAASVPIANVRADTRDYIYRNILGGGDLIRPTKLAPIDFDIRDPARREVESFWESGPVGPVDLPRMETTRGDAGDKQTN